LRLNRTERGPFGVIRDQVEPTADPALPAVPRLRSIFALQPNIAMCHERNWNVYSINSSASDSKLAGTLEANRMSLRAIMLS
jgi:hypothetical protein